jgi:protein-arginine kinase activator protein McsA
LIIDKVVCPYHKADHHVGKHPKHAVVKQTEKDPVEKMKLLKLQLAKAIELEEYERAAEINTEIKQLTASFPSFFSDQ